MTETIQYDLFIVYADGDADWVERVLIPSLGVPSEKILTKEGFRPGADKITEFERAVISSQYTLLVLSPAFFSDVWALYSESIVSYSRAKHRQNCLLPLILHHCELPLRIEKVVPFDCTDKARWQHEIERLRNFLNQLEPPLESFSYRPGYPPQLPTETGIYGKTFDKDSIVAALEEYAFYLKIHLSLETLLAKIYFASASLHSWPNTFFKDCPPLEREEVHRILEWIHHPLPEDTPPITIVTGKAGAGKSVILRSVLEKLQKEQIPVLGIKTDEQQDVEELDLPDGIKATLVALVKQCGKAVVLFDQIDALSLSASSDRRFLNAYLHQIKQLSRIHGLRIVLSCRTYDLKTDPFLQSLDNIPTIEVGDLQEEEILSVLSHLKIGREQISPKLLELLKVPLHLRVFADIYQKNMDLMALTTLQDLYDKLWERRILSTPNWKKVVEAIEMITDTMDASKSLFVSSTLQDINKTGIQHLLRQSLLIPEGKQLQFFHQTFFDYCYARTFLNRHDSLIEVVLHQHQGLFVRSQIKQVLTYLRGSDPQKYLAELHAFLTHLRLKFHLWLLVVNQLAFVDDPTKEEWRIVKSLLDTDSKFTTHFLEALHSEQWLTYLIDYDFFWTFLESEGRVFNLAIWKLQELVTSCTDTAVAFLDDFPSIENKDEYIGGILLRLDHWENPQAVELFECYLPTIKGFSDRYSYYRIMKSVFPYQPERVCKLFLDNLKQRIQAITSADEFDKRNVLDSEDVDLFQKIREWDGELALSEGLDILSLLVEKTKWATEIPFYNDEAFYGIDRFERHLHDHWALFELVQERLLSTAKADKHHFLELIAGFETSYSFTLLKLLIQGYLTHPERYVEEGLRLLIRPGILEHLTDDDSGGYEVRSLLKGIYPHLSSIQKETINTYILSANPTWELRRRRGYLKYRLLCAIPKDDLKRYPIIAKQFYEFERKFGPYEEQPPEFSGMIEAGPPLPKQAYQKMTAEQWISSFLHYDESTNRDAPRKDFSKGGIEFHARKFTEEVSKRPEKFYDLVCSLTKRDDISPMYLDSGIRGLVQAGYDVEKLGPLVKIAWTSPDNGVRKSVIQAIDAINKADTLDPELLSILEDYALHDPDPPAHSEDADPLFQGINSVRGATAECLAAHGYKTSYPDRLFDIMTQVAHDPSVAVRCCLIRNLQGMLRWDPDKTCHLFMTLTQDYHPQVIKFGLSCLSYLIAKENFQTFLPHLRIAMGIDEQFGYDHVQEYVGQILMLAYVREYAGSQELLEEGFRLSEHIKAGAVDFASKHLLESDNEVADKSTKVFLRFLDEDSEEIGRKYNHVFYRFKPENFNPLYSLIEKYTTSKASRHDAYRFFDYLMKCVEFEPEKCIDLLQHYINFNQPDTQQKAFVRRDKHVQILIGAYNKTISDEYKEKVMDIFDKILQDRAYKHEGLKVLTEQDRG